MLEIAVGEARLAPGRARLVGAACGHRRIVVGREIDDAGGAAEIAVARAHAAGRDHAVVLLVRRQDQQAPRRRPVGPALEALESEEGPGRHGGQGDVEQGERQDDQSPRPADVQRDRAEQQRCQTETGDREAGPAEKTEFHRLTQHFRWHYARREAGGLVFAHD